MGCALGASGPHHGSDFGHYGKPQWCRASITITRDFGPHLLTSWQQEREKSGACTVLVVLVAGGSVGSVKGLGRDLLLGKARKGQNVIKVRSPASLDPLFDNALWTAQGCTSARMVEWTPPAGCSASTFG